MLKDKVILVTGGSRGIGRATALLLAENGAKVIVNYNKSEKDAEEVVTLINEKEGEAIKIKADVSNENEVKEMFSQIRNRFGKIDILINNAGIVQNNLLLMTKTEEFDRIVDTNCKGVFLCMRFAAKMMMKKRSGKIINISSIVGRYGNSGQVVYSGSKAFIIGLTKSAAKELGMYGITVNAVAPGLIETDMIKGLKEEIIQNLLNNIHLGRMGTPEDVAKVILSLCSDLGDYVSGQVIGVDGCQIM
ncbi:MAG: 3-oxoacyl-ACP reductase FabG [Thermoplasmata archaeon]|nr:MAG: 3-oxoacyl-ACP reductase FabG [Thermoplasmata archaeon]